ncbi:MAG: hypothetical protein ABL907_10685 [Hyphomicrobium sp.]
MTGTDLEIIPPPHAQIAGDTAERLAVLRTNAKSDYELLAVWLKSHADGSEHTRVAYQRIGGRFLDALATDLRHANIDHVQTALEILRTNPNGSTASPATVNANVAVVKSLLGFSHRVGFTSFNAGQRITLRKAPR